MLSFFLIPLWIKKIRDNGFEKVLTDILSQVIKISKNQNLNRY